MKEQQIVGRKTKTIIKNRCNWKNIEKRKRDEDYSAEKRPAYGVASQSRRRYLKKNLNRHFAESLCAFPGEGDRLRHTTYFRSVCRHYFRHCQSQQGQSTVDWPPVEKQNVVDSNMGFNPSQTVKEQSVVAVAMGQLPDVDQWFETSFRAVSVGNDNDERKAYHVHKGTNKSYGTSIIS